MIEQKIKYGILLLITLLLLNSTSYAQGGSAVYTDSLGSYCWFDQGNNESFTDSNGKNWFKITENRSLWDEAILIRTANIYALILLGFDSVKVAKDVFMFDEGSPLFTKLSHLRHGPDYVENWKMAFNSDSFRKDANKSVRIKSAFFRTDMVLKFYSQKAKMPNIDAIGLTKKGFIKHSFEAGMEIFELVVKKISGNKDPNKDPIFDMHLRNSQKLLKKVDRSLIDDKIL